MINALHNAKLNIGYHITNADGKPFKNKTALSRAKNFYSGYKIRTPHDGDYTCVMADGTCKKKDGEYPITRYGFYNGKWAFQYIVGYPTGKNEKRRHYEKLYPAAVNVQRHQENEL